MNFNRTHLPRE